MDTSAVASTSLNIVRAGAGEPLVLLHPIGLSWRAWRPVLPLLVEHHDVIAVDLPGFGESPSLPPGVTPGAPALADAVERDLDALRVDTAHLVGNSLGGRVALELARRGRARTVLAIAPPGTGTEAENDRSYRAAVLGRRLVELLGPLGTRVFSTPAGRTALGIYFGIAKRPWRFPAADVHHLYETFRSSTSFFPVLDWILENPPAGLDAIECPVVIAWGSEDRLLPPVQATRYATFVPGAELKILPGVGHVPMADDPGLIARLILGLSAGSSEAPS